MIAATTVERGDINKVILKVSDLQSTTRFKGTNGGEVVFSHRQLVTVPTFIDYLRSGY